MLFLKKKGFTSRRSVQKRRKQYAIRAGVFAVVLILLSAAFSWASWHPRLNIHTVNVLGNTTVSEEDVRSFLEHRLDGGYLNIISRANVFLFQPRIVEEELRTTFKKIKEVTVSRDSLQSIVIDIDERKPFYLWCEDEMVKEKSEDACYFLDIDGYTFAPAPYFSGSVYFEFYKPFSGDKNPIGTNFLPETEFKRLIAFRNSIREMDIEVQKFKISDVGDYVFVLKKGTEIFFNPKQDFDILFHNLAATFDTEQFASKKKQGFFLEYIDLRFENKVYYRFQ
ncbi:MAG: FtsQ-type POTRA domain-containing protein [Parcubacteria group bacterium]|nr:FtsQ-type POTRA domain-containing protein [Parcubacteria group bacterium]